MNLKLGWGVIFQIACEFLLLDGESVSVQRRVDNATLLKTFIHSFIHFLYILRKKRTELYH